MQVCARPDALLPMHLISFFGHYGVPVFLFLSAFGLERKYGNTKPGPRLEPKVSTWGFIRYHFLKLFKMMIVGFVCFTIVDAITPGSWHYTVVQILTQLGMVNNFLAHPDDNIWPGPYWFFGLMLQLYLVYRLLLYRHHWGWTAGLMAVCLGIQMVMGPESEAINYYRYNFMGGMLPFGLGILFARYGERIILHRVDECQLLRLGFRSCNGVLRHCLLREGPFAVAIAASARHVVVCLLLAGLHLCGPLRHPSRAAQGVYPHLAPR